MLEKQLFKKAFILLFIVGGLAVIDRNLYLTWNFWWFDKIMHFMSGATVAMTVTLLCIYFDKFLHDKMKIILVCFIGVLIVGILWELFELYFGITSLSDGMAYYKDTGGDLLMDVVGGIAGALYSLKYIRK